MITIAAAAAVGEKALLSSAFSTAAKQLPSKRAARHSRRAALELLGVQAEQTYYYRVPLGPHPLLDGHVTHPDDLAAFISLAGPGLEAARRNDWLTIDDDVTTDLSQAMVLIGSPESEPLAQLLFDYRSRMNEPGLEHIGETVTLPYRWQEDPRSVTTMCGRYVQGAGLVERPNWPLIHALDDGSQTSLVPLVDRSGLLQSDWLVVTVVPNFLSAAGLASGRKIISVAGVHGTGTRAIANVLRDRKILVEIEDRLRTRPRHFQLVFEITKLSHDARRGSKPAKLRLHAAVTLERPDEVWRDASEVVASRFTDWSARQHYRNRPTPDSRI